MINCGEYLFNSSKQIIVLLQAILMMLCIAGKYVQIPATKEDLKLGFKFGFQSVVEYRKILGQTPISPIMQMQVNKINKAIILVYL
jgi:hypothetical protein